MVVELLIISPFTLPVGLIMVERVYGGGGWGGRRRIWLVSALRGGIGVGGVWGGRWS